MNAQTSIPAPDHDALQKELNFERAFVPGSAKKAVAELDGGKRDLIYLDPAIIKIIEGFNPRVRNEEYEKVVADTTLSILQNGFYADKPLEVFIAAEEGKQVPYLTGGHRRHEAVLRAIAQGAPIEKVPCILKTTNVDQIDMTVALVKGNEGSPLSPLEVAVVIHRLVRFGLSDQEIANRLVFTPARIGQLKVLASAPMEIRKMVIDGKIAADFAIRNLQTHKEKALDVLRQAVATADGSGRKASGKHVPDEIRRRVIKNRAPQLFDAMTLLKDRADVFASLPEDVRTALDAVLSDIDSQVSKKIDKAARKAQDAAGEQTAEVEDAE